MKKLATHGSLEGTLDNLFDQLVKPPKDEPKGDRVSECDHGIVFDEEEAKKILAGWKPSNEVEFVAGNPASAEIRRRWPRLFGLCPKGCGFNGIGYASFAHYTMGDW